MRVVLNRETVVNHALLPAHLRGEGYIGLQCHADVVQFRKVRIQSL
ncbi:MAG: DUF1080 domain-containing protein [Variovorax sp.]|nr:MAG: DUF1080 domain-containing protein [Variovorax sp.]